MVAEVCLIENVDVVIVAYSCLCHIVVPLSSFRRACWFPIGGLPLHHACDDVHAHCFLNGFSDIFVESRLDLGKEPAVCLSLGHWDRVLDAPTPVDVAIANFVELLVFREEAVLVIHERCLGTQAFVSFIFFLHDQLPRRSFLVFMSGRGLIVLVITLPIGHETPFLDFLFLWFFLLDELLSMCFPKTDAAGLEH